MRTPFGTINTEDRPRTQALHDHERRQLVRLGATLELLSRAMRNARTVRDAVDIEIQIEKQLSGDEAAAREPEPQGKPTREFTDEERQNGPDDFPYTPADEMAAFHAPSDSDLIEAAWGIIANAGEGNWDRESSGWRDAAVRWREEYHAYMRGRPVATTPQNGAVVAAIAEEVAQIFDRVARILAEGGPTIDTVEEMEHLMQRSASAMRLWAATGRWTLESRGVAAAPIPDATEGAPQSGDPEVTRDMLLLIYDASMVDSDKLLERVKSWTPEQRREVDEYAGSVHLRAADNEDVAIPPMPTQLEQALADCEIPELLLDTSDHGDEGPG